MSAGREIGTAWRSEGEVACYLYRAAPHDEPACALIEGYFYPIEPSVRQRQLRAPESNEPPIPGKQGGVGFAFDFFPAQLRTLEGGDVLRIGYLLRIPAECGEFVATPFGHAGCQIAILVIGEVLKRRGGAEFLALKQHGHERSGENESSSHSLAPGAENVAQAVAQSAIAHLIVILRVAEQAVTGKTGIRGRPWTRPREDE